MTRIEGYISIAIVTVIFFVAMHKLQAIEDRITHNGQVMHNITSEIVVINPGELCDVMEAAK